MIAAAHANEYARREHMRPRACRLVAMPSSMALRWNVRIWHLASFWADRLTVGDTPESRRTRD